MVAMVVVSVGLPVIFAVRAAGISTVLAVAVGMPVAMPIPARVVIPINRLRGRTLCSING